MNKLNDAHEAFAEALKDWDNADCGGYITEMMARRASPDLYPAPTLDERYHEWEGRVYPDETLVARKELERIMDLGFDVAKEWFQEHGLY